ncbi:MAG: beta-lactamase family protein [Chloroflexi bacterium]|nr:beta-lactamase family protein [Chloroflexota bacterium]
MRRAVRRPLLAIVLVALAGTAWAALAPGLTLPVDRTAAAPAALAASSAASSATPAGSPSESPADPSGSPTPAATPTPTATPTPVPTPTPTPLPVTIEEKRAVLSATLLRLRAAYGIPGISAAMTFPDGTSWVARAGFADVTRRRVVTATTEFAAGSISKTFTSALILRLAEDGRLSLDAPVRTYLPTLAIDPAITVRQLLDHTSGLDDFFSHAAIDKALLAQPARPWSAAASLKYVGKPYFRPGAGWRYSNTNYLVLGMVAEEAGGAPLATQLRAAFFDPLGLRHTFYQWVEKPRGPIAHGYRYTSQNPKQKGIDVSDGTSVIPFTSVVTAAGGAGSIATTASDLVRWARALYGGSVLRPETLAAMVDDATVTTALKSSVPYGLGVQVVTIDGRQALGHSGRLLGFRAVMRWLPTEGIAVTVMTNQSRTDPNLLVRELLRSVIGVPPPPCAGCLPPP